MLEYSEFRHFLPVVERAKEACNNSGHSVADHFEDYLEEIEHGKGAKQKYDSVKLSRYACYLIVQNADPSKEVVAQGQTYFAEEALGPERDNQEHLGTESPEPLISVEHWYGDSSVDTVWEEQ